MGERKDRPSRLGRGLVSLLGQDIEGPAFDKAQPQSLFITALEPGRFQPRRDVAETSLEELTASIKAHGVLQPILVRPHSSRANAYELIAGERRWRAAQHAGLDHVPVLVRDLDDATAMAAALIENLQRQDLNAIEEAEGLKRLAEEFGLTQETVAASVGKSRSHVTNTLRLLALPPSVQQDVRRGTLSAGHARALLTHPNPALAARTVLSRGLNVRQTEALSRGPGRQPGSKADTSSSLDIAALEKDMTESLGIKTKVTFNGGGGQLTLFYSSLDQLEGLVQRLKTTL